MLNNHAGVINSVDLACIQGIAFYQKMKVKNSVKIVKVYRLLSFLLF